MSTLMQALPVLKELFVKQSHLYSRVAAITFWPNFIYSVSIHSVSLVPGPCNSVPIPGIFLLQFLIAYCKQLRTRDKEGQGVS